MMNGENFLDLSVFEPKEFIGKGNFGQVYKVRELRTNEIYAAKITNQSYSLEDGFTENILFLFREIRIMSALNHPSIIRYIGYSANDFEGEPNITIITDYAPNKSLSDIIQEENEGLSHKFWDATKKLICIFGIASGVQYLHHNKVIHRDLKIDNILMDKDLNPKIGDFGLSKIFNTDLSQSLNMQSQNGLKGTPTHMAPEIIKNYEYSEASDVYAYSMIVYQIMSGRSPFEGIKNSYNLFVKISTGYRPQIEGVPDVYKELIEKCWSQDPKERPSFDEIVDELINDRRYIDELEGLIDEDQFLTYVDYIENYETTFDINSKKSIHLSTFLDMKKSKNTESNELEEESHAQTKSEELDKIYEERESKSCVSQERIQPKYEIFFKAAQRHKSYSDEYYESQNDHRLYKISDKLELKILVDGHKFSILPIIKSLCHYEINGVLMDDDVSITYDFHGKKYKLNYISTYSYDEYMDAFKILAYQSSDVCLLVFSKESLTSINDILNCYNKIKMTTSAKNPLFYLVGIDANMKNTVDDVQIKEAEQIINPFKTCFFKELTDSGDELSSSELNHQIIIESYIENRLHLKDPEDSFNILCVGDKNEKNRFFDLIKLNENIKNDTPSCLQIMRTDNDKKFSLYFFYTKLEEMIDFKTEIDILIFVFPLNDRFIFDLIVNSWPEKMDDSLKKVPIFLVCITNEELNYNNDNPQFLKWEEVEEFQEDKENICQAIKCKYNDKDFMYLKNMLIEVLKYIEEDGDNHNHKHKHKHKKK